MITDKDIEEHYQKMFKSVLATLKLNKVMVSIFPDGIYIRLAGNIDKGEAFSEKWAKVLPFEDTKHLFNEVERN